MSEFFDGDYETIQKSQPLVAKKLAQLYELNKPENMRALLKDLMHEPVEPTKEAQAVITWDPQKIEWQQKESTTGKDPYERSLRDDSNSDFKNCQKWLQKLEETNRIPAFSSGYTYCLFATCKKAMKECEHTNYIVTTERLSLEEAKKKYPEEKFCEDWKDEK